MQHKGNIIINNFVDYFYGVDIKKESIRQKKRLKELLAEGLEELVYLFHNCLNYQGLYNCIP